jgi:regulator of protease activity HflC (stomatin/prohibitin superfamily)
MIRERVRPTVSGFLVLGIVVVLIVTAGFGFRRAVMAQDPLSVFAWVLLFVAAAIVARGLFVLDPNEGKVLQLFENYVKVQSEAAVRNLVTRYPYDAHLDDVLSLRGSTAEVAKDLKHEVQDRLSKAGVEVIEARLSHLAYASEIAAAMLRRQQAGAIIAARQKIVEGAVGMVDMALELLAKSQLVKLDEERKAAMVSNLLVVRCADREVQPVVNTGTLYQ